MQPLRAWLLALRPRTLSLSLTPVLVAAALAWREHGELHFGLLLALLLAAMAIQIGVNLHNDAADFRSGTDGAARLGPPRASAQGWLPAEQVERAAMLVLGLAFMVGIWLVQLGGWPILLIGLAALAGAWGYSAGPSPISRGPWGELVVWLFFGLAATLGSYYLLAGTLSWSSLLAGVALGAQAAAVLLLNNHRDRSSDRAAGRATLAMRLGLEGSRTLYRWLLLAPYLLLTLLALQLGPWVLLATLAAPVAWSLVRRVAAAPIDSGLNSLLAATAGQQLLWGGLLCLGCLAGGE